MPAWELGERKSRNDVEPVCVRLELVPATVRVADLCDPGMLGATWMETVPFPKPLAGVTEAHATGEEALQAQDASGVVASSGEDVTLILNVPPRTGTVAGGAVIEYEHSASSMVMVDFAEPIVFRTHAEVHITYVLSGTRIAVVSGRMVSPKAR